MGGGMIVDGRIYPGARPGESEIGLMRYDKSSGVNVESRCCGWALDRKGREHGAANPNGVLARLTAAALSPPPAPPGRGPRRHARP